MSDKSSTSTCQLEWYRGTPTLSMSDNFETPTFLLDWHRRRQANSVRTLSKPKRISVSDLFIETRFVNFCSWAFKLSLPKLKYQNLNIDDKYRPAMEYMYYSYCLSLAKKWTPITSNIIFGNMIDVHTFYNTDPLDLPANHLSVTTTNNTDLSKYSALVFILLTQQQEIANLVQQLDYLQNHLRFVNSLNEYSRDSGKKLYKVRQILINLFKNKITAPHARRLLDEILNFNQKIKQVKRKVVVNLIDDDSDDDNDIQTQSDHYGREEKESGSDLILPVYGLSIAETNKIVEVYAQRQELEYYAANKLRVQTISLGNGLTSADEKDFPTEYAQKKEFEYYHAKKGRVQTYSDNS